VGPSLLCNCWGKRHHNTTSPLDVERALALPRSAANRPHGTVDLGVVCVVWDWAFTWPGRGRREVPRTPCNLSTFPQNLQGRVGLVAHIRTSSYWSKLPWPSHPRCPPSGPCFSVGTSWAQTTLGLFVGGDSPTVGERHGGCKGRTEDAVCESLTVDVAVAEAGRVPVTMFWTGPLGRLVKVPRRAVTTAGPRWRGLVRIPTRASPLPRPLPRPPGRPRGMSTGSDKGSEVLRAELQEKVFSVLTEAERTELASALMGAARVAGKAAVAAAFESASRPTLVQVCPHFHPCAHCSRLTLPIAGQQ
jgi:hypothetical protein